MNSTQPEESTRKSSEPFVMVTVAFFPLEAGRQSAKALGLVRKLETNLSVDCVDDQFLPRTELETFAQFFWNDNLEFWRHFYGLHGLVLRKSYRYSYRMSIFLSIAISYYDREVARRRNQNSRCRRRAGTKTGPRARLYPGWTTYCAFNEANMPRH